MNGRRLLCRLVAALVWCAALQPAAAEDERKDLIELDVGYGFGFPPGSGFLAADPAEGILEGLDLDHLIRRVLIQRALQERLLAEIDYDSHRNEGFSLLGGNLYSLLYRGEEGELLRELSVGNKYLSIPGTRFVPIDAGNPQTFALRASLGKGRFSGDALLRYGVSQEGRKRFRGSRRVLESRMLDVEYVRGRFFLLPDANVNEPSLRVYRTTTGAPDRVIDGKPFALLVRQADYMLDNTAARLSLQRALAAGEELSVTYTKDGASVGAPSLGLQAIIDPSGLRAPFNTTTYPQYFDSGLSFLYLKKNGLNSYWDMRNAYALEDLAGGQAPADLRVSLFFTDTGAANENYSGLLDDYILDPVFSVLLFTFRDASGFYPRPFPGEFPFPTGNPFADDNPVYGGLGYPTTESSVNTLVFRYTVSADAYFLDFDLVEGSVRVTVDGVSAGPSAFSVDYASGMLTFNPGVLGPSSEVEVTYRFTPAGAGRSELFAAARVGYDLGWLQAANLTTFTLPVSEPPAPQVGEERPSDLTNSTDLALRLRDPAKQGLQGELKAGVALSLATPNSRGEAIVADMESGRRYAVSVREEGWVPGSRSGLLPAVATPVLLQTRGELRYENYWERRLFGGDQLHDLSWDNSGNPQFDYARKAGPYNSADHTEGGEDRSLVLDFSFPAATAEGYVSAATALPGENLQNYSHFNVLLRGAGLAGDTVRLYAELLQSYQEDLDGDDALDGESSSSQAGFPITPVDGMATVLGSDRLGEANGRLDSEDLDGSGTLDPLGPFALDQEKGTVLAPFAGPFQITSVAVGDSGWHLVSLDLGELLADAGARAAFQQAKALRLTVKPASSPTASGVSGKLLVNGVWFSAAGPESTDPARLSLREAASTSFSESYPEVYEELHGRASYREDQGHEEKSLVASFTPTLTTGSSAAVSQRFRAPADFSAYREFRLYVYLPAGQSFPTDAGLSLEFLASAQEKYAVGFTPAAFAEGWNEVRVRLDPPYEVRVRDTLAGTLQRTGTLDVWRTVTQVRFTIAAASGDLTAPFEFWLDEWHLRESRWGLEAGYYGQGRIGFRGTLLSAGKVPILSDPYLSGGYEWAQGSLADQPGRRQDRYSGGLEARLLGALPLSIQLAGAGSRPEQSSAAGFQEGTETRTYTQRLGLDTGVRYLPTLEHSYQRTEASDGRVALTQAEYVYRRTQTVSESLSLSADYRFPKALSQSYAYSRSWRYEGESAQADGAVLPSMTGQSLSLTQRLEGRASLALGAGTMEAEALREELLVTDAPLPPSGLWESYADKLTSFFCPEGEALPGAWRSGRSDKARFSLDLPRTRYLGSNLSLEASYGELNADRAAGTRDATVRGALYLAFPFSPGGRGLLELTPKASRTVSGTYRRVDGGLDEALLLGESLLPLARLPFYYLNPWLDLGRLHEYGAVDSLNGSAQVLGGSAAGFQSMLGLEGRLRAEPWYLPSRAGAQASGDTSRDGTVYAQKRKLRFNLGKDVFPQGGAGGWLGFDGAWEEAWDYTNKVRSRTLETVTMLELSGKLPGTLRADHTLRYVRERQRVGDERLYLFPGQAGGELPAPLRQDSDMLRSLLDLRYRWEQPVYARTSRLRSLLREGNAEERIVHEEWLEVENQVLLTDRETTSLTRTVPLRIALTHQSRFTVDQGVELGFSIKAMGGVEERIEQGASTWQPALGIELRLTARLQF